jgi:hypothetical protein
MIAALLAQMMIAGSCARRRVFTRIWLIHNPINGCAIDPEDLSGLHLVASYLLEDS